LWLPRALPLQQSQAALHNERVRSDSSSETKTIEQ
jgi:hypothetical protein